MRRTRRQFVQETAALGLMLPWVGCRKEDETDAGDVFEHGVASGDPLPDAVILWTRISPTVDAAARELDVRYEVALDSAFVMPVSEGTATTSADRDFTVKVDVQGLESGTTYYYRFFALGESSVVGRTRTAPLGDVERLRFAVMSCSNYAFGYFHGYRHAAERADLDAVIHLGDYIYEYGDGEYGGFRPLEPPTEVLTLEEYRKRYSLYRRDPDLRALHQQFPFIVVWDDHEFANNANPAGAENHTEGAEGSFADRRAAALQAYREWLPIRGPGEDGRIFRTLRFGGLLDLIMLDTRMWGREPETADAELQQDPERQLLGADQEQWLSEQLQESESRWRVIGQQVLISQATLGGAVLNSDQWDGYAGARLRLFDRLEESGADNVVVITGDLHVSGAGVLMRDPSQYDPDQANGVLGVEFVAPGITSPFIDDPAPVIEAILAANPNLRWADGNRRGYFVLDIVSDRVQAEWYLYPDPEPEAVDVRFAKAFTIAAGDGRLVEESDPAEAPDAPALAPKSRRF